MGGQRLRRTFMTPRTEPLETTALVTREGVAPAPDEEFEVPVNWRTSKRHKGRVVLAGSGSTTAGLMMITSSVLDEDTAENVMGYAAGIKLARAPALLKGPHGVALKDLCTAVGIAMSTDVYFTALCKWLLPQGKNLSPKPKDCAPGVACLDRELQEVKPKIVVTFGKPAFEFMVSTRVKFLDAVGMPFWSEKYQCQVVPMQHYYYLLAKPELNERFALDLAFTAKALAEVKGVEVQRVPLNYFTIRTREELLNWVIQMLQMKVNLMCVDCEWHGRDHVDGELRSMQLAWAPGCAIYIRFRDEHRKYVFDCSYAEAGSVLGLLWNRPEFKLVGHHISADFPWAHKWLGLEFYDKAILDTEFAFQCLNEHGDRGLERMSMRYTDLGRYEFDLEVWKKENKVDASDGYGMVPDEILIPYACKDVDVPLRAYPIMRRMLEQQGMWGYYSNIMNPFVTNGFTQFALTGLPMNRVLLEEMREVYHYARKIMEQDLAGKVHVEAGELLVDYICQHLPGNTPSKQPVSIELSSRMAPVLRTCFGSLESLQAMAQALGVISEKTLEGLRVRFEHYQASISFNIRSPEMLKRWLFDVKEYTPVKSTANKEKGVSSMDWTKVMALPENRRKDMKPAVDKQTLVILCEKHKDPLLNNLLELNAVGNLCKAFLSQPERDADGQIIEEAGLIAWIASDGCVHGQFSMTETGRPRSWKPNSLNWPSGVQDRVRDGVARALKLADEKKVLPENMRQYLDGTKKILPLRACVQAPEGWCIVESDFATAELRALAYRAGDADMIEIMVGRDTQFGLVKIGDDTHSVRLSFGPKCGIRPEHQSRACILAAWKEGKLIRRVTEEELLRDERGDIKHPGHDLHWSLAEMVQGKPREVLAKSDRNAAKVGNFSSLYGATPATLERKVEADTGVCPEPGTGEKLLKALEERQPVATAFLKSLEEAPENPGFLRAASGKVRHFVLPSCSSGAPSRLFKSLKSAQGREARNFYMQESVAATAMRSENWLQAFGRRYNLMGVPMTVLYDSVCTLCPAEERLVWAKAHDICMFLANGWEYHGRILRYPIETDLNSGWSLAPAKDPRYKGRERIFSDPTSLTSEKLKPLEDWLDLVIQFFRDNERASLNFEGLAG